MCSRAGDPGLHPLKGESQRRGEVAMSAQPDGSPARAQQILQAAGVACAQAGSHHSRREESAEQTGLSKGARFL
jgi:hypothetical protein